MELLSEYRITVYLNSGQTIQVEVMDIQGQEPEQIAEQIQEELAAKRPHWRQIGNAIVFTGAVSGLEIDAL